VNGKFKNILFAWLALLTGTKLQAQLPFAGVALEGYPIRPEQIADAGREVGLKPEIVVFFTQWPEKYEEGMSAFPLESFDAIWQAGAVPCLTWEPMTIRDGRETAILADDIVGGKYDAYLLAFARQAVRWPHPFIIRLAHEMNLDRYHWGTAKNDYGPGSPAVYRRMFAYIARFFRVCGADNVIWCFCPNVDSIPDTGKDAGNNWNTMASYYPGDDVIDIVGLDGYDWRPNGTAGAGRSFESIFAKPVQSLKAVAPRKPLVVFETASPRSAGDRKQWLREMVLSARSWNLQGIVWFQVKKEMDWRLTEGELGAVFGSSPAANRAQEWVINIYHEKK
jgi:hypothetical protein